MTKPIDRATLPTIKSMPAADKNSLVNKFLRHSEDAELPTQPAPQIYTESLVTPLIDGAEYAKELAAALDRLGKGSPEANAQQFIFISGWWLGLTNDTFRLTPGTLGGRMGSIDTEFHHRFPFCLNPWPDYRSIPFQEPPDESSALLTILKEKARAGVKVKVLGWVNPAIARRRIARQLGASHVIAINTLTLRSLINLRQEPAIGCNAIANIVCHTVGSSHSKIVVICDGNNSIGFTGGIDFEMSRWARHDHAGAEIWHDVVAKVEGPAVQSLYDHFQALWNANIARPVKTFSVGKKLRAPSKLSTAQPLPDRTIPVATIPTGQAVQELVTFPAAVFSPHRIAPRSKPLPSAPDGLFTYRAGLKKAILTAQRYIYIEDQLFWSAEVMTWLNTALISNPELRLILLFSGRDTPHDPELPHVAYLDQALNNGLLPGLAEDARARIAVFRRAHVKVHAKTVIIDDAWAAIGSCNIAQRSLYTDIEHGVSFVDNGTGRIRHYRAALWAHHFRAASAEKFDDLTTALSAWRPEWKTDSSASPSCPPWLVPVELPVAEAPFTRIGRWLHDSYRDCDSRQRWSGLPRLTRRSPQHFR